jgi:hypothetical protein
MSIHMYAPSLRPARLFYGRYQPDGLYNFRPRCEWHALLSEASNGPTTTELTDDITEDWGGKPFVDLQAGWKFVLAAFPEVRDSCLCMTCPSCRNFRQIDPERAVAAGASWGGYAIKWVVESFGHISYTYA